MSNYLELKEHVLRYVDMPTSIEELMELPQKMEDAIDKLVHDLNAAETDPFDMKDKVLEINRGYKEIVISVRPKNEHEKAIELLKNKSNINIKLMFEDRVVGYACDVNYSIGRDAAPIYTIPGRRNIAGSLKNIVLENMDLVHIVNGKKFNVLAEAVDRDGHKAMMKIIGCESIISEDYNISDKTQRVEQITYIAQDIDEWKMKGE